MNKHRGKLDVSLKMYDLLNEDKYMVWSRLYMFLDTVDISDRAYIADASDVGMTLDMGADLVTGVDLYDESSESVINCTPRLIRVIKAGIPTPPIPSILYRCPLLLPHHICLKYRC